MSINEFNDEIRKGVLWALIVDYYKHRELNGPPVYGPEKKQAEEYIAKLETELFTLINKDLTKQS